MMIKNNEQHVREFIGALLSFEGIEDLAPFVGVLDGNAIANGTTGNRLLHHIANGVVDNPVEVAKFLVEKMGADPNLRNRAGNSPIHFAANFSSEMELFEYLASISNINALNKLGHPPLITAIVNGNMAGVIALANLGADIDIVTVDGNTVSNYMELMFKKEGLATIELIYLAKAAENITIEEVDGKKIANIDGYIIDLTAIVPIEAPAARRRL